jgi:predicted O-methyltransferase YrrM
MRGIVREMKIDAVKAGVAKSLEIASTDALVGRSRIFSDVWNKTSLVPGSFSRLNAAAMFVLLEEIRPRRIVEIGSYLGKSTTFFALAAQALRPEGVEVVAIDPHTGDRQQMEGLGVQKLPSFDLFESHIRAAGVAEIVRPIVMRSTDAEAGWTDEIDFLYIDGWHSYDAVIDDGRAWIRHLSSGGAVFFDDYTRYAEVFDAVRALDAEGTFDLWTDSFGQALGGNGEPTAAANKVSSVANRRAVRRLHRLRS